MHSGSHFVSAHPLPIWIPPSPHLLAGWMPLQRAWGQVNIYGTFRVDLPKNKLLLYLQSCLVPLSPSPPTPKVHACSMDLLTTHSILYSEGSNTLTHLDHSMGNIAILYVDHQGYYQGDWRGSNFEPVQQITTLFDRILRAFFRTLFMWIFWHFLQKNRLLRRTSCIFINKAFLNL